MPRILVVDNDPQIHDTLAVALPLQWPDVTVVVASNGNEALRALGAHPPDIVLLKVELPDHSGFEVLHQIRQVSDVPVILLDGQQDIDEVRGLHLGADDYLIQPIGARLLAERIKAVLRRSYPSPRALGSPNGAAGADDSSRPSPRSAGSDAPATSSCRACT